MENQQLKCFNSNRVLAKKKKRSQEIETNFILKLLDPSQKFGVKLQ